MGQLEYLLQFYYIEMLLRGDSASGGFSDGCVHRFWGGIHFLWQNSTFWDTRSEVIIHFITYRQK